MNVTEILNFNFFGILVVISPIAYLYFFIRTLYKLKHNEITNKITGKKVVVFGSIGFAMLLICLLLMLPGTSVALWIIFILPASLLFFLISTYYMAKVHRENS